jgi:hypothetical protein
MVVPCINDQGAPGWCCDTFLPDGPGYRQMALELLVGIEKLQYRFLGTFREVIRSVFHNKVIFRSDRIYRGMFYKEGHNLFPVFTN